MDDMLNLKDFISKKVGVIEGSSCGRIDDFSVDELKELRYLATLAMVEKLVDEHGSIMKDVLGGLEK